MWLSFKTHLPHSTVKNKRVQAIKFWFHVPVVLCAFIILDDLSFPASAQVPKTLGTRFKQPDKLPMTEVTAVLCASRQLNTKNFLYGSPAGQIHHCSRALPGRCSTQPPLRKCACFPWLLSLLLCALSHTPCPNSSSPRPPDSTQHMQVGEKRLYAALASQRWSQEAKFLFSHCTSPR